MKYKAGDVFGWLKYGEVIQHYEVLDVFKDDYLIMLLWNGSGIGDDYHIDTHSKNYIDANSRLVTPLEKAMK